MTTIVAKGTNRPAARARRNRHAQQGPKQAAAKAKAEQQSKLTADLAEIRAEQAEVVDVLANVPWEACRGGKDKLCPRPKGHGGDHNKLTRAEQAKLEAAQDTPDPSATPAGPAPEEKPRRTRKAAPARKATKKAAAQKREEAAEQEANAKKRAAKKATGPTVTGTTPVQRKANKFRQNAEEAGGWQVEIGFADGVHFAVATREDKSEFVRIAWHEGKIVAQDMPSVAFADGRTVHMRNLAECIRQLRDSNDKTRPVARVLKGRTKKETPTPEGKPKPARKPRKAAKKAPEPEPAPEPAPVPPDDDVEPTLPFSGTDDDGTVYRALVGKTIEFRPNGKNDRVELYIPKAMRIEQTPKGRMLRFANGDGEHAVRLDKVIRVR